MKKHSSYLFQEPLFKQLMSNRIGDILMVCSDYDRFMLEEDGRIDEMLFQEYVSLNLRYPPQLTQVSSPAQARAALEEDSYDLVIIMLSLSSRSTLELARGIRREHPQLPIVVLTPINTRRNTLHLYSQDTTCIDYIFAWQGNPNILLAMVKLIEDRMNLDFDVKEAGVQTVILVEDSVRYYSSYLPLVYLALFRQTRLLMTEGLNEWQQTMRMRSRPKVLLARNYEEALNLYETYKSNLLGVITDVSYNHNGKNDRGAGFRLCEHIRTESQDLPIVLQSSDASVKTKAPKYRASFIHKHSQTILTQLRDHIRHNYGFGDFIFRDPTTLEPIASARNLRELQHRIIDVPQESFVYHARNNDISKWLKARALFPLANYLRPVQVSDFETVHGVREFLVAAIKEHRRQEGQGTIVNFRKERFDEFTFFARMGKGSLGGKGRGLAFIDQQIKKSAEGLVFPGVNIAIPRSLVLATDLFDQFMESNNLLEVALSNHSDEEILERFLTARFPEEIRQNLQAALATMSRPLAVRSSSMLEDSHLQPFAGIYNTYMLPNNHLNFNTRLAALLQAIKAVYASTYYARSKDYMKATNNMIEEEKMAVIIQEVTGGTYRDRHCYPNISGVARSLNYYPVENERPEDGVANIALGLGKTVVEGGVCLRFCPKYPKKIMQLTDVDSALKTTQKKLFALDLDDKRMSNLTPMATSHIVELDLGEADKDQSLSLVASTYDFENHALRDDTTHQGERVLTFAPVLKHNMFPLAPILRKLLEIGQESMKTNIEIEFAVNLDTPADTPKIFSLLQIRPIVDGAEHQQVSFTNPPEERTLILSNKALGNGVYGNIRDVVYAKPGDFNPAHTEEMARTVGEINAHLADQDRGYVLVVPGRLGSTDPWLGIPTKWSQISHARVIVELGLENFQIDPSQGTHFFQNLTSLQNAYLTVNPSVGDGDFNEGLLQSGDCEFEDQFIRHVTFEKPLSIKIDGKNSKGVIYLEE